MKTIRASESKGLAVLSVRLISDRVPPGGCLMRHRVTPAPRGGHANYSQFQLHCISLFYLGCRQFAAYAAVWREHAPFSSALSIKPVCLIRVFYSVVRSRTRCVLSSIVVLLFCANSKIYNKNCLPEKLFVSFSL